MRAKSHDAPDEMHVRYGGDELVLPFTLWSYVVPDTCELDLKKTYNAAAAFVVDSG